MGSDKENMDNLNQKEAMAQINKYIWMVMPVAMSGNKNSNKWDNIFKIFKIILLWFSLNQFYHLYIYKEY